MKKIVSLFFAMAIVSVLTGLSLAESERKTQIIENGGYTVEVPSEWRVRRNEDAVQAFINQPQVASLSFVVIPMDNIPNNEATIKYLLEMMTENLVSNGVMDYAGEIVELHRAICKLFSYSNTSDGYYFDGICFFSDGNLVALTYSEGKSKTVLSKVGFVNYLGTLKWADKNVFDDGDLDTILGIVPEKKDFDLSLYENYSEYKYDRFSREWNCYASFLKKYKDAFLVFGLKLHGTKDKVLEPPMIYGWVRDVDNVENKYSITHLIILVDDTLYNVKKTIEEETFWCAYLDNTTGRKLIEQIQNANEIAVKYYYKSGSIEFEIDDKTISKMNELSRIIVKANTWDYIENSKGAGISEYNRIIMLNCPMTIESD